MMKTGCHTHEKLKGICYKTLVLFALCFPMGQAAAQPPPIIGLDRLLQVALKKDPQLKQIEIKISIVSREISRLASAGNSKVGFGMAYYPNKLVRGTSNDPLRNFHERARFLYTRTLWNGLDPNPRLVLKAQEKLAGLKALYFQKLQEVTGSLVEAYLNYSLAGRLIEINRMIIRLLLRAEVIFRTRERMGEALPVDWLQMVWQREKVKTEQAGYRKLWAVSRERLRQLQSLPAGAVPEPLPWHRYLTAVLPGLDKLKRQSLPHSIWLAQYQERIQLKRRQAAHYYRSYFNAYKVDLVLGTDRLYNDKLYDDDATDLSAQLNFSLPLGFEDNNRLLRSQLADERRILNYRKEWERQLLNEQLTGQYYEVIAQRERLAAVRAALDTVKEETRIKLAQVNESLELAGPDPEITLLRLKIKRLLSFIKWEKSMHALASAFLDLDRTAENRLARLNYTPPETSRMLRLDLSRTNPSEISAAVRKILSENISGLLIKGSWSDWNNIPEGWGFSEAVRPLKQAGKKLVVGITSLGECLGIEPGLAGGLNAWLEKIPGFATGVLLWLETSEESSRLPDSWWMKWEVRLGKIQTRLPLFIRLPPTLLFETDENQRLIAEKLLAKASGLVLEESVSDINQWITYSDRVTFIGAMLEKPVWIDLPGHSEHRTQKIDFLFQTLGGRLGGIIIPAD